MRRIHFLKKVRFGEAVSQEGCWGASLALLCSVKSNILVRAAPKVMPRIILCWPMMLETDAGITAVEMEPPNQYSITCCCHDSCRGAV